MSSRKCDRCGSRIPPYWPRKRVGDEMLCSTCVQRQSHVQTTAAAGGRHPDLDESLRTHGTVHTTGGRVLRGHHHAEGESPEERLHPSHPGWKLHVAFHPVQAAVDGARSYASQVGLDDPHQQSYEHVRQTPDRVRDIAHHYDRMREYDPSALTHYHAMAHEVGNQFHHLTHTMGVKVQVTDHDPYEDVHAMAHDMAHNKTLKVLGTHATGSHPVFSDEQNDQFRAVHDAFGHAAAGRSFDRHGEEAAYRAHSQMFTHHALPALATETRGQNASLIRSGHFAAQKIGLLLPHHYQMTQAHAALLVQGAGFSPEDVVRHEVGRQKVHTLGSGEVVCPEHLRIRQSLSDAGVGLAAQVGLDRAYPRQSVSSPHEGRCQDCTRAYAGTDTPWLPRRQPGARPTYADQQSPTSYPWRPKVDRWAPPDTTIRSLNSRHQGGLDDSYMEEGRTDGRPAFGAATKDQRGRRTHYATDNARQVAGSVSHEGMGKWSWRAYSMRPDCRAYHGGQTHNADTSATQALVHMQAIDYHHADDDKNGGCRYATTAGRRVAVALRPGRPDRLKTTSRLRFQAHDSGDGETIFHCPFCGSGQVIARSDGTVECEFCTTAFTVQVQPTMPAFPQTIDGVPVQVPGMPAGGPGANVPPGTAPGTGGPPGGPPGADDDGSGFPPGDDDGGGDDPDDGDDDKPAFLKGSMLHTAAGHALTRPQYVRHLALACTRDRRAVLAKIRHDNGSA